MIRKERRGGVVHTYVYITYISVSLDGLIIMKEPGKSNTTERVPDRHCSRSAPPFARSATKNNTQWQSVDYRIPIPSPRGRKHSLWTYYSSTKW